MKSNVETVQRIKNNKISRKTSDEAILAIIVLGLVAAVSDGKPDNIEIQSLRNNISKIYAKDSKDVLSYIQVALKFLKNSDPSKLAHSSCDLLKKELNQSQLMEIFDILSDVLIADGKIFDGEEEYLAQIAQQFELEDVLRSLMPRIM